MLSHLEFEVCLTCAVRNDHPMIVHELPASTRLRIREQFYEHWLGLKRESP